MFFVHWATIKKVTLSYYITNLTSRQWHDIAIRLVVLQRKTKQPRVIQPAPLHVDLNCDRTLNLAAINEEGAVFDAC